MAPITMGPPLFRVLGNRKEIKMLSDLVKKIDGFVVKYGGQNQDKMKSDLLDLVQTAVEHGEAKDQNKITGIIVKGIKAFMGGGGKGD
jgi:hypothetical protein